jgi:hypothetical protein
MDLVEAHDHLGHPRAGPQLRLGTLRPDRRELGARTEIEGRDLGIGRRIPRGVLAHHGAHQRMRTIASSPESTFEGTSVGTGASTGVGASPLVFASATEVSSPPPLSLPASVGLADVQPAVRAAPLRTMARNRSRSRDMAEGSHAPRGFAPSGPSLPLPRIPCAQRWGAGPDGRENAVPENLVTEVPDPATWSRCS